MAALKNGAMPSYKAFGRRFLLLKSKLYITSSVILIHIYGLTLFTLMRLLKSIYF